MEQYLIDTNVVSDYFSASFPAAGMQFMDAAIDAIPNFSVITQIELLCWKTDAATEQKVKDFIADIIAATALAYGYTIITNNEKDFADIHGLKNR